MHRVFVENSITKCGEDYYKCYFCDNFIILNGEEGVINHLNEATHRDHADSQAWCKIPATDELAQIKSLLEVDYDQLVHNNISFVSNNYYCNFCCCSIYFLAIEQHIKNEHHQLQLHLKVNYKKLLKNSVFFKDKFYYCYYCDCKLSNIHFANIHLLERRHQKNKTELQKNQVYGTVHATEEKIFNVSEFVAIRERMKISNVVRKSEQQLNTKWTLNKLMHRNENNPIVLRKNYINFERYCEICKCKILESFCFEHIIKENHLMNLHLNQLEISQFNKEDTVNDTFKSNEYVYCTKCKFYFTMNKSLIQCHCMIHLYEEYLNINFDIVRINVNDNKIQINCLVCNCSMHSDQALAEHIESIEHLRKLQYTLLKGNEKQHRFEKINAAVPLNSYEFNPKRNLCLKNYCQICYNPTNIDKSCHIYKFELLSQESLNHVHEEILHEKKLDEEFKFYKCFLCNESYLNVHSLFKHYTNTYIHSYRLNNFNTNILSCINKNELMKTTTDQFFSQKDDILEKLKENCGTHRFLSNRIVLEENQITKVTKTMRYCQPCEFEIYINVPKDLILEHITSVLHLKNLHLMKSGGKKCKKKDTITDFFEINEYFYCTKCMLYLKKNKALIQCHCMLHLHDEHLNLNQDIVRFNLSKEKVKITCLVCDIQVYNDKQLADHIESMTHLKCLQYILLSESKKSSKTKKIHLVQPLHSYKFDPNRDLSFYCFCSKCYIPMNVDECGHVRTFENKTSTQESQSHVHEEKLFKIVLEEHIDFYKCFLCDTSYSSTKLLFEHYNNNSSHKYRIKENDKNVNPTEKAYINVIEHPQNQANNEKKYTPKKNIQPSESEKKQSEENKELPLNEAFSDPEIKLISRKALLDNEFFDSVNLNKITINPSSSSKENEYDESESKNLKIENNLERGDPSKYLEYDKEIFEYGKKYVSMCIEPGETNIYNFNPDEIYSMRFGISLIFPSQNRGICIPCGTVIKLDLQDLYKHLQNEMHIKNSLDLKNSRGRTDGLNNLDLAASSLIEEPEKQLKCLACNSVIPNLNADIKLHMSLQHHVKKIASWKQKVKSLSVEFFDILKEYWYYALNVNCAICHLDFEREMSFVKHLEQPEHLARAKSIAQSLKINKCLACQSIWYGVPDYDKHEKYFHNKQHGPLVKKMHKSTRKLLILYGETLEKLLRESDIIMKENRLNLERLLEDLENTVKEVYPRAKAYAFGSSSLGFSSGNIHVFLDCENIYNDVGSEKKSQEYIKRIQKLFKLSSKDIWKWNYVSLQSWLPVINLVHNATKLKCDLSFLNGLGVEKSQLIKRYVMAYQYCRELILYLMHWFEYVFPYGPQAMGNYTISWSTIFYLQIKGIFPSVHHLIKQKKQSNIVGGWECGFANEVHVPNNASHYTFKDLLQGFFAYYAEFNYCTSVICPLLGKVMKKSDFVNKDSLPLEMEIYKSRSMAEELECFRYDYPMCLQDPVDLTLNITKNVTKEQLKIFRQNCKESSSILLNIK